MGNDGGNRMKDRFKFRAWDVKNNGMIHHAERHIIHIHHELSGSGGDPVGFDHLIDNEDFNVMQSIGIKDKNGKLIFEGDIVKYGGGFTHIVEYDEVQGFEGQSVAGYEFASPYPEKTEVIGNIHENPDRLKA